jgi:plasmid stability protein
MGGTIRSVNKTTVYLPDELKQALKRTAAAAGRSEAQVIRDAIELVTSRAERPAPRGALFSSGDGSLSERVDELLAGFGER